MKNDFLIPANFITLILTDVSCFSEKMLICTNTWMTG